MTECRLARQLVGGGQQHAAVPDVQRGWRHPLAQLPHHRPQLLGIISRLALHCTRQASVEVVEARHRENLRGGGRPCAPRADGQACSCWSGRCAPTAALLQLAQAVAGGSPVRKEKGGRGALRTSASARGSALLLRTMCRRSGCCATRLRSKSAPGAAGVHAGGGHKRPMPDPPTQNPPNARTLLPCSLGGPLSGQGPLASASAAAQWATPAPHLICAPRCATSSRSEMRALQRTIGRHMGARAQMSRTRCRGWGVEGGWCVCVRVCGWGWVGVGGGQGARASDGQPAMPHIPGCPQCKPTVLAQQMTRVLPSGARHPGQRPSAPASKAGLA